MRGAALPRPGWIWGVALVVLSGCAGTAGRSGPASPPAAAPLPRLGAEQSGQASWYGRPHHGRRTASGEVFDMHALTAAHRTLPLGTHVVVTHAPTGRSVEVRINDRGPSVAGRIIDLSYAAARRLGTVAAGVFPVTVRVVALPGGARVAPPAGGTSQPPSRLR
ncbi:MAG: septal ring lytic transglycosylase RlpA family protein [Candidatus Rokuibacteriota bacterium]